MVKYIVHYTVYTIGYYGREWLESYVPVYPYPGPVPPLNLVMSRLLVSSLHRYGNGNFSYGNKWLNCTIYHEQKIESSCFNKI